MGRSAFLPDSATLDGLFERVRGTAARRVSGSAAPEAGRSLPSAPEPAPVSSTHASRGEESLELERALGAARSLDARFASFGAWLGACTRATAVFVADAEGLSMIESEAHEGFVVAAGEIGSLFNDLGALLPDVDEGNTTLCLKAGQSVELIWCKTDLGRFTVGLVLDRPLDPGLIATIRSAMRRVAASENKVKEG